MSNMKQILVAAALALLGVALGYAWAVRGMHGAGRASPAAAAPAAASGDRRILYWHDPMKPEARFDQAGTSPFMNMPLVPVYANAGADGGSVAISSNAQQNLGIRLGRVERLAVAAHTSVPGTVHYDERAIAVVQLRVGGYVRRLHVRASLERVRRGQVLAEIHAPAWTEAEAEYLALLQADAPGNVPLREAARQRLLVIGVPEAAIADLERTRAVPATTAIVAPVSGVVTELGVRDGSAFEPGAVLFRLNGTAVVWIDAQVPESQAGAIDRAATAEIRALALPGRVFHGRVQAILPQLDAATRTVGVRVAIDNSAGELQPGMFVQASFTGRPGQPQLWVPTEAVIATGERSVVIVKLPGGAFEVAPVTLGTESGGKTAVISGLTDGQQIVLSGQFLIDSEASLAAASNRLAGAATESRPGTP